MFKAHKDLRREYRKERKLPHGDGARKAPGTSVVWFRLDLRLTDNPALHAAIQRGGPIVPVFIWAPDEEAEWPPGEASRWWLHQSLVRLNAALRDLGSPLIIRNGPSLATLQILVREARASALFWNRRYEPALIVRDHQAEKQFCSQGCRVESFDSNLLLNPFSIRNKSNKPFQVFSAFWRHSLAGLDPEDPLPAPRRLRVPPVRLQSLKVEALGLEPKINWASGISAVWNPGEAGALKLLKEFCANKLPDYRIGRDGPGEAGTSRLSPHLHFGEIGPRQIWHALRESNQRRGLRDSAWKSSQFLTEIGWREFAYHLVCNFPRTPSRPLREEFGKFPWRVDGVRLKAWQRGETGYPIVDAGMRELWTTGWMHNRVRMVVASFLVKDLMISWQEGAKWFWDTLVDADLANNTLGWQWTAGCGADPAPFFRIFNPVTQGEKFDPDGRYVRRWVPELAPLPNEWIHRPWQAPARVIAEAAIDFGKGYPKPIVDHSKAREIALNAFGSLRKGRRSS